MCLISFLFRADFTTRCSVNRSCFCLLNVSFHFHLCINVLMFTHTRTHTRLVSSAAPCRHQEASAEPPAAQRQGHHIHHTQHRKCTFIIKFLSFVKAIWQVTWTSLQFPVALNYRLTIWSACNWVQSILYSVCYSAWSTLFFNDQKHHKRHL